MLPDLTGTEVKKVFLTLFLIFDKGKWSVNNKGPRLPQNEKENETFLLLSTGNAEKKSPPFVFIRKASTIFKRFQPHV